MLLLLLRCLQNIICCWLVYRANSGQKKAAHQNKAASQAVANKPQKIAPKQCTHQNSARTELVQIPQIGAKYQDAVRTLPAAVKPAAAATTVDKPAAATELAAPPPATFTVRRKVARQPIDKPI